jgi:hypothetical protein
VNGRFVQANARAQTISEAIPLVCRNRSASVSIQHYKSSREPMTAQKPNAPCHKRYTEQITSNLESTRTPKRPRVHTHAVIGQSSSPEVSVAGSAGQGEAAAPGDQGRRVVAEQEGGRLSARRRRARHRKWSGGGGWRRELEAAATGSPCAALGKAGAWSRPEAVDWGTWRGTRAAGVPVLVRSARGSVAERRKTTHQRAASAR